MSKQELLRRMKDFIDDIYNEQLNTGNGDQEYITEAERLLSLYDKCMEEQS